MNHQPQPTDTKVEASIMARSRQNYYYVDSKYKNSDFLPIPKKNHIYSVSESSSSTSNFNLNPDLDSPSTTPRTLYANTFDRPFTSQSLPSSARRPRFSNKSPQIKNMGDMIGDITEEEFDALPIAVRRKVRDRTFDLLREEAQIP